MPRRTMKLSLGAGTKPFEDWEFEDHISGGLGPPVGVDRDMSGAWINVPTGGSSNDNNLGNPTLPDGFLWGQFGKALIESEIRGSNGAGSLARYEFSGLTPGVTYLVEGCIGSGLAATVTTMSLEQGVTGSTVLFTGENLSSGTFKTFRVPYEADANGKFRVHLGGDVLNPGTWAWAYLNVIEPDNASGDALLLALKTLIGDAVPEAGPIYTYMHAFADQEALRDAATVTLGDGTTVLRLILFDHSFDRRRFTNGTYEVVHRLRIVVSQAYAAGAEPENPVNSEREVRQIAEKVMTAIDDDRPGTRLQKSIDDIGGGWLGYIQGVVPRIVEMGVANYGGETFSRAIVELQLSEEIDF